MQYFNLTFLFAFHFYQQLVDSLLNDWPSPFQTHDWHRNEDSHVTENVQAGQTYHTVSKIVLDLHVRLEVCEGE